MLTSIILPWLQSKMRLLDILVLLGLCLVFTKAESDLNDGTFDDFFNEQLSEKASMDDEPKEATLNEDPKDEARRAFRPSPFVSIPIAIPGNTNSVSFSACYCFRRRCYGKCLLMHFYIYRSET